MPKYAKITPILFGGGGKVLAYGMLWQYGTLAILGLLLAYDAYWKGVPTLVLFLVLAVNALVKAGYCAVVCARQAKDVLRWTRQFQRREGNCFPIGEYVLVSFDQGVTWALVLKGAMADIDRAGLRKDFDRLIQESKPFPLQAEAMVNGKFTDSSWFILFDWISANWRIIKVEGHNRVCNLGTCNGGEDWVALDENLGVIGLAAIVCPELILATSP